MAKTNALFLTIVFLLSGFVSFAQAEQAKAVKLGYIDVALVFDGYSKTKELDASLSSKSEQKKQERDKMAEKIKNMKSELELLGDKEKEAKQDQIYQEERKLQDFENAVRSELRKERDNMAREILKEIDVVIKEYSQKNGYIMVFNNRILVYAQEQDDLTQEILSILNSKYKKK